MTVPPSPQRFVTVAENKVLNINESTKNNTFYKTVCEFYLTSWKAVLAELIATFFLVFFGCMSCVPIDGFSPHPPLYTALGFGLVVMMNVEIFGPMSGAYFNPSVTLLAVYKRVISIPLGVAYFIAQGIGAILGYSVLMQVAPHNGICVTLPHSNVDEIQAFFVEIALTATLALVCCSAWDPTNEKHQDSMPIKFGLVTAGLSIVGGPLTGASLNPTRTLAPALWTGNWEAHWVYWVGPLLGASVAPVIYKLVSNKHTEEKSDTNFVQET